MECVVRHRLCSDFNSIFFKLARYLAVGLAPIITIGSSLIRVNSSFDRLGNVLVENLETDQLIIFTNNDGFQTNSKKGNRVKTKLKF